MPNTTRRAAQAAAKARRKSRKRAREEKERRDMQGQEQEQEQQQQQIVSGAPRLRTTTADTTQSDETAVSDYPMVVGDAKIYQDISPYNPEIYKCTGYGNEEYEYFDGTPGQDARFTIDLEGGSTDRLRDVRPYLYYVGFWCIPRTPYQPEVEQLEPAMVEESYVRIGREFLMSERQQERGYFLADREWASMNEGSYTRFPFGQVFWGEAIEGDQGCDRRHDPFDYKDDCCFSVMKTNIRTSLPRSQFVLTSPDAPEWDRFIQWIYGPSVHGAMDMVDSGWPPWQVEKARIVEGTGCDNWLIREED